MSFLGRFINFFMPRRTKPSRRCQLPKSRRLEFDVLEVRRLLAWTPIGPAPLLNSSGQVLFLVDRDFAICHAADARRICPW